MYLIHLYVLKHRLQYVNTEILILRLAIDASMNPE